MDKVKVSGKNAKHKVLMYALSTCAWCKKTKQFLKDNGVEFEYIDVDLCTEDDRKKVHDNIRSHGGDFTYPTLIVDDKTLINGYREDKMRKIIEI